MRILIVFGMFLWMPWHSTAQTADSEGSLVNWMSLDEAMEKVRAVPRPMIIDFYTDWCGWCKKMMKTTYADPNLAQYINNYFYPVKFDAEGKDTVEFLGESYAPVSDKPRSTHPLAAKLLKEKLMYPSTLFLNGYDAGKPEFKVQMIANGYLEAPTIEPILIFILENAGRNASYDEFNKNYTKAFRSTAELHEPEWLPPASLDTIRKKSMVFINTGWCNSCKVMKRTSFSDTLSNKYILENFDLVDFDPEITDTIMFNAQTYVNPRSQSMPFHQLAFMLGRNSMVLPSLIVLDENKKIIDVISSYVSPAFLNDIAHYYGSDVYLKKSWEEYVKSDKAQGD